MKKKGVEMSMNVIIIAAIGLLILLILAFLVVNYVTKVRTGAESCTTQGGVCQSTYCSGETISNANCPEDKPTCCKLFS